LYTLNSLAAPILYEAHTAKMRPSELRRLRLVPDHDASCQSSAIVSGMHKRLPGTVAGSSSPQRTATTAVGDRIRSIAALHGCRHSSAGMVRVIVKLRPEQYDELFRHVREVGSTMSAFCRDSVVNAMRDEHPDTTRCED
jgi:hypothetical protein